MSILPLLQHKDFRDNSPGERIGNRRGFNFKAPHLGHGVNISPGSPTQFLGQTSLSTSFAISYSDSIDSDSESELPLELGS